MEIINNTKIPERQKLTPNSIPEANTPINSSNKEKQSPVVCNGNECNENFPCPSCSYNSAVDQLDKAEQELILAKKNLQLARKNIFLFLNSSPNPIPSSSPEAVNENGDKRGDVEDCGGAIHSKIIAEAKDSDEFVAEKSRDREKNNGGEGSNLQLEESVSCQNKNADEDDSDRNGGGEESILQESVSCQDKNGDVVEGDDSDRNGGAGGGEGSNLELVESVSCKRKDVEKENADESYAVEGEDKCMDDSQESSVSDDSVDDFDGDLALLSQMFGESQSREIDNDREELHCVKEDEINREAGVEVKSAEKDDPFTNFQYYTPAVKKRKLARHVTFSPVITVFPDGAARNDNEASRSEPARHAENNLQSPLSSEFQSPCAVKDDLFAEFRYDKSNVRSRRNVTTPELSMITEQTARYYKEAKRNKLAKRSANPAIPDSKRKRLYWTHEEEEKLVDCVRIFLNKGCNKMSWKSILDYGSRVFNRSRTPEDLRYKWKSMVKQASRVERR